MVEIIKKIRVRIFKIFKFKEKLNLLNNKFFYIKKDIKRVIIP